MRFHRYSYVARLNVSRWPDHWAFCPMVRFVHGKPYVINPHLSNRERMMRLSLLLWGRNWRTQAARTLGCERMTVSSWAGTRAPDIQPPEEAIAELLKAARRKLRELEIAIEEVRFPPWMP